jgi:hypothetical protein
MLDVEEMKEARGLYKIWFEKYPKISNPTDMNCVPKWHFITEIGPEKTVLMQRARKGNLKKDGYPYPWTKGKYWKDQIQEEIEAEIDTKKD